jgi:hypothetical protein
MLKIVGVKLKNIFDFIDNSKIKNNNEKDMDKIWRK